MTKRVWIAGGMKVTGGGGEPEGVAGRGFKPAPWDELWATNRLTYGTTVLVV
jgi:hypothetical protein